MAREGEGQPDVDVAELGGHCSGDALRVLVEQEVRDAIGRHLPVRRCGVRRLDQGERDPAASTATHFG